MIGALLARYQPVWLEHVRLGAPLWVGPTGELALFTDGRWDEDGVFVQLISKIDEAGTHGSSPYMTMGGYAGRLWQWNCFDNRWKKALRKAGLQYFHVKEHNGHPFALKGVNIANDSLLFGFVVRLDRSEYQSHYRQGGWGGKAQPDSMYGLCFRYCLSFVLQQALAEMAHQGLSLNFIVDGGHPNCGAATEIVNQLKRKRISGVSEYLGVAVPGEVEKTPGLQAADGLASGAWHMESDAKATEENLINVPQRVPLFVSRPYQQLKAPIFRCHIDEAELAKFKEGYFDHIRFRQDFGRSRRSTPTEGGV